MELIFYFLDVMNQHLLNRVTCPGAKYKCWQRAAKQAVGRLSCLFFLDYVVALLKKEVAYE